MRTGIQLLPWLAVTAAASGLDARSLEEHQNVQRSLEDGTWAVKTRSLFDDLGTCSGCENILALIKGLVKDSDDGLISIGSTLCTSATSYDSDFCKGVVQREGPVIAQAIRAMELNSTIANQFCITFLGVCDYPAVQTWNVPFPSKQDCSAKRPVPAANSDKKPLQIIQFSDIHITPGYTEGASTQCGRPVCCTGATGNNSHPAGLMADHNCDTSPSLAQNMYDFMHETFPDQQQISLFTGDIIDHDLANTSETTNTADIHAAFKLMSKLTHLYSTIGNHESSPANIFYPDKNDNRTQWVYDEASSDFRQWFYGEAGDKSANTTLEFGGYSYLLPSTKLRIISLNTNMYYTFNFALYDPKVDKDPLGQIAWLVGELDAAEKAGENVYIIGHMAPGDVDALHNPSNYLDQVIRRYQNTIRAMFYGHTHWDQFAVSYNDYDNRNAANAMAISYICPSLTPTSGMPSFRVYDVDPDTYAVLDVTTWYSDMTDKSFQTKPTWKKLYSAKEAYGSVLSPPVTDPRVELSPAFWHNVTVAFEKNATLFGEYRSRMSRGWNVTECTGDCQKDTICELRGGRSQDNCHHPTKGVHFAKRSDADISVISHTERDECGVPLARDLFHALARSTDMLEMLSKKFVESGAVLEPIVRRAGAASSSASPTATATPYECGSAAATGGSSNPKSTSSSALADAVTAPAQLGGLAALAVGLLAL